MKKLLILLITFTFATELEVDGDLKVTGNIDAQNNPITNVGAPQAMTDAVNAQTLNNILTDDGVYEYNYYGVHFLNSGDINGGNVIFEINYREVGDSGMLWNSNWVTKLNTLSSEGWEVRNVFTSSPGSYIYAVYELRKKIEE